MNKVIIGMLVKNEAGRYLKRVIDNIRISIDPSYIFVLDDRSTDGTVKELKELEVDHIETNTSLYTWESNEFHLRKHLLNKCEEIGLCNGFDYVGIIDADEIYQGKIDFSHGADYIGLPLFDMWSETHYREDSHWRAHKAIWPMFVKIRGITKWDRLPGLHCGRFPISKDIRHNIHLMPGAFIKHMGWSNIKDRWKKFKRYMRLDPLGQYGILEQYISIMDSMPNLIELAGKKEGAK